MFGVNLKKIGLKVCPVDCTKLKNEVVSLVATYVTNGWENVLGLRLWPIEYVMQIRKRSIENKGVYGTCKTKLAP